MIEEIEWLLGLVLKEENLAKGINGYEGNKLIDNSFRWRF